MNTKRFFLIAVAGLFMLGLLTVNSTQAFDYTGAAWCCETDIVYCINPEEPDTVCGPNPRSIIDVVNAAAASWNAQGTAWQLVYGGTTTDRGCVPDPQTGNCMSNLDGKNVVSMATCPMPPGVLATAWWWFTTTPDQTECCIFEADICFSHDFSWYKDQDASDCPALCYDMESVVAHEFGHWASLGHEDDDGVIGYRPVMYFSFAFCEIRRAITADDAAGLDYIYDATGVIVTSQRCDDRHSHPAYVGSPKTPMFMNCLFDECDSVVCQSGTPFCDSTVNDPCIVVCPQSDIVFEVKVKDQCGNPICDSAGTWLDFSACLAQPCPGEEPDWPKVFSDSCDPATGIHYFTVDASMLDCTQCEARLIVNSQFCRNVPAYFLDAFGDFCVDSTDLFCMQDFNCDGLIGDPGDSAIFFAHMGHCCPGGEIETCCEYHKSPYLDYAPNGMPDFDQKAAAHWIDVNGNWSHCGPVAVANCLWWFDSKFEPNPIDPRPFGAGPQNDGYGLVTSYLAALDDHDTSTVIPLVDELAAFMNTNNPGVGAGTQIDSLVSGTRQYIASRGLSAAYMDSLYQWPSYPLIRDKVLKSYDVILLLGIYSDLGLGNCCRIGGHYVTVAGVCTTDFKICISDPFYDALEGEPPAGSAHGATVHNDAFNISGPHGQIQHDQYGLAAAGFGCIAAGVTAEIVSNYPIGNLANFVDQNGEAQCAFDQPFVVIEYAYVICPDTSGCPDADNDGVCDQNDICPGFDDNVDSDNDGVPDGCDVCPGFDDNVDSDNDGVPDGCDVCPGFDDNVDSDNDGVPDGCDVCPGFDDGLDGDNDGVPDGCDVCPGFDDLQDSDSDGVPDGCDICPGFDDNVDSDNDGVPDGCDRCPGFDDGLDGDNDGVPDGCDVCPGFDDGLDGDNDGVPDGCDVCPGFDDLQDADGDGVPDSCDNCPTIINPSQADFDNDGIGDACCCIGIRGDLNGDGTPSNILDLTYAVDRIFRGGPPSDCPNQGDVNGDGASSNILDLTYLVDRIFRGGPLPPPC